MQNCGYCLIEFSFSLTASFISCMHSSVYWVRMISFICKRFAFCSQESMSEGECMKVNFHLSSMLYKLFIPWIRFIILLTLTMFIAVLMDNRYTLFWVLLLCSKFAFNYFLMVCFTSFNQSIKWRELLSLYSTVSFDPDKTSGEAHTRYNEH